MASPSRGAGGTVVPVTSSRACHTRRKPTRTSAENNEATMSARVTEMKLEETY